MVTAPIILCLSCVSMHFGHFLPKQVLLRFTQALAVSQCYPETSDANCLNQEWMYLHNIYCLLYVFAGCVRAWIASRLCTVRYCLFRVLESEHALVMHPWINRVLRVATVLPGYLLDGFVNSDFEMIRTMSKNAISCQSTTSNYYPLNQSNWMCGCSSLACW